MNRDLVLEVLERVLDLAGPTVADAPAPAADPELAVDLRELLRALYFALRRYRNALTDVIDKTAR